MSSRTKKFKFVKNLTMFLSGCLMFCPSLFYIIKAMITTGITENKIAMVSSVFVVMVLTLVALVRKFQFRSRIWILLIGIYICLGEILTPIIIIGSCQILDELIVTPLHRLYKLKYTMNKEIDLRGS